MPRIVVVGAGISGLTVAYRLEQQLGMEVTLLEERERVGGTIDSLTRQGFLVEAGPNGFPDNNPATLSLAQEIGLAEKLIPASESASKNRFLALQGRLRRLPNSFGTFLTSDLLSWLAKLNLLAERFRGRRSKAEDESIEAFARRRVGNEITRTFVDAFVTGILAGDPKLLSMQAAFPRLAGWEREHGSITRGMTLARKERRAQQAATPSLGKRAGSMWSFQKGLKTLVTALGTHLRRPPLLGVRIRRVRRQDHRWIVEAEGKDCWDADAVVLTCPAYRQAEILADLDAELVNSLDAIPYNRIVVVAFGYRREDMPHPLDGFGYLSPQRERRDVLGVQWCSSIFPGRAPEEAVLLRALCGGWHRQEMVDWPDDRLVAAVRGELAQLLGVRVAPIMQQIIRWPRAIPQYHVGHLQRIAWIEQRLGQHSGLFLGGNSFRGVAINDCVEQSSKLAEQIVRVVPTLRQ